MPQSLDRNQRNKRVLWFVLPLLVFVGLLWLLYLRLGQDITVQTNTAIGRRVPAFNLSLLAQDEHISQQQLPKRPYLLNVWGSWCPTCHLEHPFLLALHKRGVPMVGINYKDDPAAALSYLNDNGNPFVFNIQDSAGDLALDLGLTGAPETFVVDDNGIIRQHIIGEMTVDNWQQRIAPCWQTLNQTQPSGQAITQACQ